MTIRLCFLAGLLGAAAMQDARGDDEGQPPMPRMSKAETVAVEHFAKDMQAVKDWIKAEQDAAAENEARYQRIPVALPERLAKVRAEGLPAALSAPFTALKANATAHAAALAGMPQDDALVQAWMTAKLADPKAAVELGELASRGSEIESELISAGMAYRIARQVDIHNMSQIEDRWVVILGAHKDFHQAKADAERIARASGVPFSMNGMIYDKKGLRFPDNYEDEVFAGGYLARRFNSTLVGEEEVEEHVSVEKSEEYQGFAPGYYIVVGSVAETSEKARTMVVEQFRKLAPKAYVKKTEVYLGCMH